jgi:protein involved in sex pheromone biosynthesis
MIRFLKTKGKYSKDKSIYINMEKFSKEWKYRYKETLTEKFKYLFLSEMHKHFELINLQVTDISYNGDVMEGMDVDVEIDYQGACDGDAHSVGHMLSIISNQVHEFFFKHQIDPVTFKFKGGDVDGLIINDPMILEFHYKLDELHKVLLYITMNYDQQ